MKRYLLPAVYLAVLAGDLLAIMIGATELERIFKPLLMLALAAYFILNTSSDGSGLRTWIIGALAFSWLGDVLLMFQANDSLFFLLGLSAFLVAHVFYITFFHRVRARERLKAAIWAAIVAVLYYIFLMVLLSDHLGEMKTPVRIYGLVICFMWMLSLHMVYLKNRMAAWQLIAGAVLFVISDSLLAINKFYEPFEMAGPAVMLTYGVAQLLIVTGAIQYLRRI